MLWFLDQTMHQSLHEDMWPVWLIPTRPWKIHESRTIRSQCYGWETMHRHSFIFLTGHLVTFLPFRLVRAHEAWRTTLIEACNAIAREVLYFDNLYSCSPNTRKRDKTGHVQQVEAFISLSIANFPLQFCKNTSWLHFEGSIFHLPQFLKGE